jgi:hypothetical protein
VHERGSVIQHAYRRPTTALSPITQNEVLGTDPSVDDCAKSNDGHRKRDYNFYVFVLLDLLRLLDLFNENLFDTIALYVWVLVGLFQN